MTITAPSGAAPHSSGCTCAGPDHSLARERAASGCLHIAPTSVAIVRAKSIWARAAEVTQKTLPSRRARQRSSRWRSPERAGGWSKAASVEPLNMRRLSRPGLSAGAFPCRHTRRGPSANTTDADLSLLVHAYAITPRTTSGSCAMRPYERGTPAGRIRRLLASSHPRILLQVSFAAVQGDA